MSDILNNINQSNKLLYKTKGDDEIIFDNICSITKKQIVIPARTKQCQFYEIFDRKGLESNIKK